jgi:D-glycero-alpha-D-manno-heptose 1-phosphate guanylyltransferase
MFEAVILAGGEGTRLKSVTGALPKPMVEINGLPFVYLLMQRLEKQGCSRIVLSLCYCADYIIDHVEKYAPVVCQVDFAVEKVPMGTGGAIKFSSQFITSEKFVVLNGDTYSDIDYNALVDYACCSDLVISAVRTDDVARYGTLDIDDNHVVLSMNEKGRTGAGIVNSGTYVITTSDIQNYPGDMFSFEQDYIQKFKGKLNAFVSDGYFIDIGIPEDYYKACLKLK